MHIALARFVALTVLAGIVVVILVQFGPAVVVGLLL